MNDLQAFLSVAHEKSFTKAAAKMGISPSALSHTIRSLEERLGVRLLARTTRNVSPTEAGEKLMRAIGPLFEQISAELEMLGQLRDKPAGSIRLTCSDDAVEKVIRPKLAAFLAAYPDIDLEISIDYGFTNIVKERFDAGIRLGESISKDMIAVRLSADWRLCVVGSPGYFSCHPSPRTPQELTSHNCINIRHSHDGARYAWEFEKGDRKLNIRVNGQLTFNSIMHVLNAAVDGIGLGYIPDFLAKPYLDKGQLVEVLDDWSPYFEGFHLYYPHRRQASSAFSAFVDTFRFKP